MLAEIPETSVWQELVVPVGLFVLGTAALFWAKHFRRDDE